MSSNVHKIALSEAFHRVPETCPAVYKAATKHSYAFTRWVDTRFAEKLTEQERNEIAGQLNVQVTNLLEDFKSKGTLLLRDALVKEIENNLLLSLSDERILRIEAGEDLESTLQPKAA